MADKRSQIVIEVVGLDSVRKLNTALNTYEKHLEQAADLATKFGAAHRTSLVAIEGMTKEIGKLSSALIAQSRAINNLTTQQNAHKKSLVDTEQAAAKTTAGFGNLLKMALQYRAVSFVFNQITDAVRAAGKEVLALDYQMSRVRRVSGANEMGSIRAQTLSEMTRTGQGPEQVGEAFYQLGTFVKNADARLQAVRTTMDLVVGTESDVRSTTQAVLQVFQQFGNQMDKTVSDTENFRRIGELIAITYKGANVEVGEVIQTLKYLGPIAEAARVPVEQLFAVIGGLEGGGQRGRTAGTSSAQFLSKLIQRGDEKGDITQGGYVYKNIIQRTSEGGADLIKTLERVRAILNQLNLHGHTVEAEKFVLAMGGTQNAVRFVGTLTETLEKMKALMPGLKDGMHGLTNEAENLKNIMQDNLPAQMQRAWTAALGVMAGEFKQFSDGIHLTDTLRNFADKVEGRQTSESELRGRYYNSSPEIMSGARLSLLKRLRGESGDKIRTDGGRHNDYYDVEIEWAKQHGYLVDDAASTFWGTSGIVRGAIDKALPGQEAAYRKDLANAQSARAATGIDSGSPSYFEPPKIGVMDLGKLKYRVQSPEAQQAAARKAKAAAEAQASALEKQAQAQLHLGTQMLADIQGEHRLPNDAEVAQINAYSQKASELFGRAAGIRKDPRSAKMDRADDLSEKVSDYIKNLNHDQLSSMGSMFGMAQDAAKGSPQEWYWAAQQDTVERQLANREEDPIKRKEMWNRLNLGQGTYGRFMSDFHDRAYAAQDKLRAGISVSGLPPLGLSVFGDSVQSGLSKRLFGIDMAQRTESIGYGSVQERAALVSKQGAISGALTAGKFFGLPPEVIDSLVQDLSRATKAVQDFDDAVAKGKFEKTLTRFQRFVDDQQTELDVAVSGYNDTAVPVSSRNQFRYGQSRNRGLRAIYQGRIDKFGNREGMPPEWQKSVDDLDREYKNNAATRRIQKSDEYGSMFSSAGQDFYHGRTGIGGAVKAVGDKLVDTALDTLIRGAFDPLSHALGDLQIAIEDNTNAIAGGGAGGAGAGAGGGKKGGKPGAGIMQALGYGAAAYSVYQNGAQNGVTLGGVLGGAAAGFQLGGPWGAVAGAGLDLLGGLFGHKKTPTYQDTNPAFQNSPADFEYNAYRMRATGVMPNLSSNYNQSNAPIINITLVQDGVKTAVSKAITVAMQPGNVALVNAHLDMHSVIG